MKYYKKILQPDEQVKIVTKLHWVIYARAIVLISIGVISCFAYALLQQDPLLGPLAIVVATIFLALGVFAFLHAWIVRVTTEVVVTDRRVIHKVGLFSRHTEEMNVSKVETVDVDQGILGRIFGYGTVRIRGTGGGWEPLPRVASPLAVRNAIVAG